MSGERTVQEDVEWAQAHPFVINLRAPHRLHVAEGNVTLCGLPIRGKRWKIIRPRLLGKHKDLMDFMDECRGCFNPDRFPPGW